MRAFLGINSSAEFDKIVLHEILPAIAKAYSTLAVSEEAPGGTANEILRCIHNHFLDVVEDYAKNQLSYHLSGGVIPDDTTAEKVKIWREQARNNC